MKIGAMIISVDEPQLERCLEAVKKQTVPFSEIVNINNVVPEFEAFNKGVGLATEEWVLKIDGDMILYDNAVELVVEWIDQWNDDKICIHCFNLYDTFLESTMGYCCALKTSVYKLFKYENVLNDDQMLIRLLRKKGWLVDKAPHIILGTHFDNPNEFQVFRRFYIHSIKNSSSSYVRNMMKINYEKTKDPIYEIGLKAIEFGKSKKVYPTSHNIDFDRKMFEEFKNA